MTLSNRFSPERMLLPGSLSLSGTATTLGQTLLSHIRSGNFSGRVGTDAAPELNADLAILADDPPQVEAALAQHARNGAKGAIVLAPVPGLHDIARAAGIRVLGPHSFGIMLPGSGLNASLLPLSPAPGGVALIAQSASLAQTIIDWAVPNGIGFSRVVGIGGNADIGFALVLDHISRDPATKAILIEIDRLRDARMFLSAARVAARLRPVVALVPGARLRDPAGNSRAAAMAAFARAGVLLTETFGEFLAAAETLTRVRPARGPSLSILANSHAAGRLAGDAALARGIALSQLGPATRQILATLLGPEPPESGPIFTPRHHPTKLAEIAALLSAAPEIGGILVVHTPEDLGDDTVMAALIACAKTVKIPLLIAVLGEASGGAQRRRLTQAGLACFDTPEAAIDGFAHLIRNRANRAAARELPASKVLQIPPDSAAARAAIDKARTAGREMLVQDEALAVAAAYHIPVIAGGHAATPEEAATIAGDLGFPVVVKLWHPSMPTNRIAGSIALDLPDGRAVYEAARAISARMESQGVELQAASFLVQRQAPRGRQLRIRVADDAILGPVIGFGPGGGDPDDISALAVELPPLNLPLAYALIARSPAAAMLQAHRGNPAADQAALAAALVRVSQMVIDIPDFFLLDFDPLFANEQGVIATSGRIFLRPTGTKRPALIISPYPSELIRSYEAKGETFSLRPIRPEDADAHGAFIARISPEDLRYRFFSARGSLPPEEIARLTDVDYGREMAFIAVRENGETAGVARLARNDSEGAQAEFAVLVDPCAKGKGVATRLMQAIIDWGKSQGVKQIDGQILADNAPMLGFIRRLGFLLQRDPQEPDIINAKLVLNP